MALAKLIQKPSALLLQNRIQQILPSTSFKTSATVQQSLYEKYFGWARKEYDDQGELGWPDDDDLATGMWKKELEARKAGIEDPYCIAARSRGNQGTKIDPIRVPSSFESRMIACKCHEDQLTAIPMWVHQGEMKRCRCGFWFVAYYQEPFQDYTIPQ